MTEEEKRRKASAAPAPASAAPQMMAQSMQTMGAQAAPMTQGLSMGQLTNPTGMVGMPGMEPGFVEPDTVGTGLTADTIGVDQVRAAMEKLKKYKQGKQNLEQKVIENETWYRLRHWDSMNSSTEVKPTSAWLFNCISNKHADAMDNFPAPNVLPREEGDKQEAKMLSSIIPVVLDQTEFERTYSDVWDDKLTAGTGIYGVFWDNQKLGGLGDISIRRVDILNVFWEPGITDIQHSRNFFHVELRDNDLLEAEYPALKGKSGDNSILSKYNYDDSVDTNDKSSVIDWYYKKRVNGRTVVHYCKFVGEVVLYASENDPQYAEAGWYNHGLYPFVFDPLFPAKGTPCGFSYVDVGKSAQEYIDRGNQAIMMNMLANAKPRHFIRSDGSVNEKEYADITRDFVHVDGNLGQDSILPIQGKPLSSIYVNIVSDKIDELKETTGNRDVSNGGSTSGVTAASAIAAMQEAGSKLSRDHSKTSYRQYRQIINMVIELIRQFYDLPRQFRIVGENGAQEYVTYSNQGIAPQAQGSAFGVDLGYRLPMFDIEITAQKASPYSKLSQNELALQFFGAGFFNPQLADQALVAIDMMDFDRKDSLMQKIIQNKMQWQQEQMMAMMGMPMGMMGAAMPNGAPNPNSSEPLGGEPKSESGVTRNARERVAESTSPT